MGYYQTRKRSYEMSWNASTSVSVIKAIFSSPNCLEMIMSYIQTIVFINKKIRKRYGDEVRTRNLNDSGQAIQPQCYDFSLWLVCAYNILHVIKCMHYSKNSE